MRINTEAKHMVNYGAATVSQCVAALLALLLTVGACERQDPPPKPIGSATNKHVEETPARPSRLDADTMIQQLKTPMEDGAQTEELLKGGAERTIRQTDQSTP